MGRILAFDFGYKRTGIAVTDNLKIIASGLSTVPTGELFDFLARYLKEEEVELFVVGEPRQMDNTPSEIEGAIQQFISHLQKRFPAIPVKRQDERFTSKMAVKSMIESGVKKKKRREKGRIDEISATLILQSFLSKKII